jgi:hypothetical protein
MNLESRTELDQHLPLLQQKLVPFVGLCGDYVEMGCDGSRITIIVHIADYN